MFLLLGCMHSVAGIDESSPPDATPTQEEDTTPVSSSVFILSGGTVVGLGPADVLVSNGVITAVGDPAEVSAHADGAPVVDVAGQWLAPAFIDSHVHLAYLPQGPAMAAGGVAGAVDLAAPIEFLAEDHHPLQVRSAGPMVTAVNGYPTLSWGRDGYGLECADATAAAAAVDTLAAAGAGVIKLPVTGDPVLDSSALSAAASRAHTLGLKVTSHALSDDQAATAASIGADALAHTPTEALSATTISAWASRAVISTLGAFGGTTTTLANLTALRAAGATVLYGTDFGNTQVAGIDPEEISLLQSAGLDGQAILDAGTRIPAAYWGFDTLGAIAPDYAASLLVLDRDPLVDPSVLAAPSRVFITGVELGGT